MNDTMSLIYININMISEFIYEIPRNTIILFLKRVNHNSRKVASETIRKKISEFITQVVL